VKNSGCNILGPPLEYEALGRCRDGQLFFIAGFWRDFAVKFFAFNIVAREASGRSPQPPDLRGFSELIRIFPKSKMNLASGCNGNKFPC
jgi:hypothetical protein